MNSIATGNNIEARHFMDDEHQITIGLNRELWPKLQLIANEAAREKGWLSGKGDEWSYLNIWIVGRVFSCPKDTEACDWISAAAN